MNFNVNTNSKLYEELLDVNFKVLFDIGKKDLELRVMFSDFV